MSSGLIDDPLEVDDSRKTAVLNSELGSTKLDKLKMECYAKKDYTFF